MSNTPDDPNPHNLTHCQRCGIYIFEAGWQAEAAGIPFYTTINIAVGNLCYGCAIGDKLKAQQWRDMGLLPPHPDKNDLSIITCEVDVMLPALSKTKKRKNHE